MTASRPVPPAGSVVVVSSVNRDTTVRVSRFPAPGETVLGESVTSGLGGKGANQAVAAARAGARSRLLATVGDDTAGEELRADLQGFGVGVDLLAVAAGWTSGTAHITVDASGQNSIVVVPGANAATGPGQLRLAADDLRGAGAVVVQSEIPVAAVAALVDLVEGSGVPVVLNLAPVVPLPEDVLDRVGVLVVNETEASQVLGRPPPASTEEALAVARALTARVASVILTVGAAGAVVADRSGAAEPVAAPRPSKVVDTTGAGDALVGVLAAAVARGADLRDAVGHAVKAATASVQRVGAAPSYLAFDLPAPSAR